jgi:hypothetical protein
MPILEVKKPGAGKYVSSTDDGGETSGSVSANHEPVRETMSTICLEGKLSGCTGPNLRNWANFCTTSVAESAFAPEFTMPSMEVRKLCAGQYMVSSDNGAGPTMPPFNIYSKFDLV